jgi:hypothetical protein
MIVASAIFVLPILANGAQCASSASAPASWRVIDDDAIVLSTKQPPLRALLLRAGPHQKKFGSRCISMSALYATPNVKHAVVDGRVVLIDLRAGKYIVLDRVASAMWQVLLSIDRDLPAGLLAERFDVPASRLDADLRAFSQTCIEHGFLQDQPAPVTRRGSTQKTHRNCLALRAWLSLLFTTHALSQSFRTTYGRYALLSKPSPAEPSVMDLLANAEHAFSRAERYFLIRDAPRDCLPRSLALYRFLLSIGIPADHCIGVRRYPFQAHAWVECMGRVIFDSADFVGTFVELARI